jgi:GNAT superfamily N-acetyltransferase
MPNDLAKYDHFWATFFGLDAERLRRPGVNVVPHAHLGGYRGLWFFVRDACVIVSTPDDLVARLRSQTDRIAAAPLPGPPLIRDLIGHEPERVIGPVYQGCLPDHAFRPVEDPNVRRLGSADDQDVLALRSACTSEEWEHSGLPSASEPRFGYVDGGQLVAVAGTEHWTADAVGPGVLSRPDCRGRGHGTAVVSAVVEHALSAGKLPLYQTLLQNTGSVAIAERPGYRRYATHVAIRLQSEPRGHLS